MNTPSAADALNAPGPAADDSESSEMTFNIPKEYLGDVKEGDTVTLRVVGMGEDGVEVEVDDGADEETAGAPNDFSDLKQSMSEGGQ